MEYDIIIDDFIGEWGYSARYARNKLASRKGKAVHVYINSYGGDVRDALDIYQQFIDHGDVTVHLNGFVASAATIIAMGAKKICMSKHAFFLVHKCLLFVDAWGHYNADQMQQLIQQLEEEKKTNEKIDVALATIYADRCGKPVADILPLLKAGKWLNAAEAKSHGFVDEITDVSAPDDAKARLNRLNAFGLGTDGLSAPELTREGVIKRVLGHISAAFDRCAGKEEKKEIEEPIKIVDMKKYERFAAAAGCELKPDDKGSVTLDAAQADAVEARLDGVEKAEEKHKADTKALNEKISALEDQVKNLKAAPGEEDKTIHDEYEAERLDADKLFNSIKNNL